LNDVRITAADGITLLDWAFHGGTPSQANRTATIQIDETNHNVSTLYGSSASNASVGAWLYYGNDVTNQLASNANNSINITTTPKTVHFPIGAATPAVGTFTIRASSSTVEQLYPNSEFRKQVADDSYIYFDLAGAMTGLNNADRNRFRNDEIAYATVSISDQDGADTTSAMTDLNEIAILENHVVRMPIKAGTHEKRYFIIATFGIVDAAGSVRVLDQRATLHVKNLGLHPV
tara:strand:+ start:416 stop:1114 length:699 start_codon:yes stop_codon:yes gene_type:complete